MTLAAAALGLVLLGYAISAACRLAGSHAVLAALLALFAVVVAA